MHVVPQLIVGVAFPGMDSAPHQKIALADAIAIRDRLARNTRAEEGDRDWFFHAFDATTLYFFVGRYHVRCKILGCEDYVVETIYEVPRGAGVERALEVDGEIAQYEKGFRSVHAGMSEAELRAAKGEPESRSTEQYFGVSWWTYPDVRVLVVNGEVKKIATR